MDGKKNIALRFIQISWVVETMAVILFSMIVVICLKPNQINSWLQFVPPIAGLIAAQGAAAGIGPLASDHINKPKEK